MTTLKMKVDGAWLPVGVGPGVAPGGTTGQVLTKKSAADYDVQWTNTPPILANNTYFQGYQADGTTALNLIGVNTDNHIYVGLGLPSGTGTVFPQDRPISTTSGRWIVYDRVSDATMLFAHNCSAKFNESSGTTTFASNVTAGAYFGVNAAKGFCRVNGAGVYQSGWNVVSVVRNGTGLYRVTFVSAGSYVYLATTSFAATTAARCDAVSALAVDVYTYNVTTGTVVDSWFQVVSF